MAMTAWLAKFVIDADGADQLIFFEHRHDHETASAAKFCDQFRRAGRKHVLDLDRLLGLLHGS